MVFYTHAASNHPLILFVDDDIAMVNLIRSNLETEGFRVVFATDGITGKQKAWEMKPDLIITDIFMPGIDGMAMLDNIREHPPMRDVPVIFLSGKAEGNVIPKPDPKMRFALMKKPIFLPELNLLIRQFLGAV